jgi:hypothetical protein
MNLRNAFCARNLSLLLVAGGTFAGFTTTSPAGEAIVFGRTKPKSDLDKEKTSIDSPFKLENFRNSSPFEFNPILPPVVSHNDANPRKDKRQQNADAEKRNWMFLDEGDLQKDNDKDFLDGREEKDLTSGTDQRDFMFKDSRKPNGLRSPTALKAAGSKQPVPARDVRAEELDTKRDNRGSAILFGKSGQTPGSQSGKDLQSILSSKLNETLDSKSSFSFHDVLVNGDVSEGGQRQVRNDTFKQMLGPSSSFGGAGDPMNSRLDLTRQPLNPTIPSSLGSPLPQAPAGGYSLSQPTFAFPNNSFNSLRSPDANYRSSGSGQSPAGAAWKPTEVQFPRSGFR